MQAKKQVVDAIKEKTPKMTAMLKGILVDQFETDEIKLHKVDSAGYDLGNDNA